VGIAVKIFLVIGQGQSHDRVMTYIGEGMHVNGVREARSFFIRLLPTSSYAEVINF